MNREEYLRKKKDIEDIEFDGDNDYWYDKVNFLLDKWGKYIQLNNKAIESLLPSEKEEKREEEVDWKHRCEQWEKRWEEIKRISMNVSKYHQGGMMVNGYIEDLEYDYPLDPE